MSTESIRERLAGATPGPWSALTDRPHFGVYGDDDDSGEADVCEPYLPQDAAFIAASRTDVELLLAVVEAAKVAAERYFNGTSLWAQINEDGTPNPPWLDDLMDDLQQRIDALEAG